MTSLRQASAGLLFLLAVLVAAVLLAALFGFGSLAGLSGFVRSASAAEQVPVTKADVVRNAVDDYIRPAYADFATAAGDMREGQDALCKAPSAEALLEARRGFAAVVTAFSRIEFVRFGPVMDDNRIERILFWPDKRGIALRQVQAIVSAKDETATDPHALHAKSVAAQGFNALEFVLFGTGAEELSTADGAFRCRYGAAIASNLSGVAGDISKGWQAEDGIAGRLMAPKASDPAYRSLDDSLQEIAGTFIHGFEAIRDLRIQPPYGDSIEKANPKGWIYQRSELSEVSLHTNFEGLSELYDRSKIAKLLPEPQHWMEASIAFEFGNAGRAFQTITEPLQVAASDPKMRDRVGYLLILTQSLQSLFADQFAPALGLKSGFSALDGD